MAVASIQKRYFVKIAVSISSGLIGLISLGIVPRALGPAQYGIFNFLNKTLSQYLLLLQFSSENAFMTKLSQRNLDKKLIGFYSFLFILSSLVFFISIAIVLNLDVSTTFFPDQKWFNICLAAAHVILVLLVTRLILLADAYALISVELMRILQRSVYVLLLLLAFKGSLVDLQVVYVIHYISALIFIVSVVILLAQKKILSIAVFLITYDQFKTYLKEFYHYSIPLIHKVFFVFAAVYIEYWLLQRFGGSRQVGFFGFSQQFVTIISSVLIASVVPVIQREFARAHTGNNQEEIRSLFLGYVPKLYLLMSFICVFFAIEIEKIVLLFGGNEYRQSLLPGFILLLVASVNPVIVISNSLFLAVDQTKLIRNITIVKAIIGLAAAYFLIVPKNLFGLNLGAVGLALKITIVQLFSMVTFLYFGAKQFQFNYLKIILQIFLGMVNFLGIAYLANAVFHFDKTTFGLIISFLASGILYVSLTALIMLYFPKLFLLEKKELNILLKELVNKYKTIGDFTRVKA